VSSSIVSHQVNTYQVRLVADLSAAAFRTKQTRELALWHCLRALNYSGSGYLGLETALQGLCQVFGYRQRTIFRTLSLGEGLFWHRIGTNRGSTIKIEGIKNLCVMFNTQLFNTIRWYDVPAEKFQTLKLRRLALWASIQKPKGIKSNPISRDTVRDYTGVERRTQQLYDRDAEVKRTPCFRPEHEQPRLPNIYHNKSEPGPKGMLVKVRRFMKSFRTDEALELRRYFGSIRQMVKTKDRVDIVYVLIGSHQRQIKGRLEWKPILSLAI